MTKGNYIDTHTHILPGVDDGASNAEQSLAMIKTAYDEGVRKIILTPHYGLYHEGCCAAKLQSVFEELKNAVLSYKDLELYLGNEIFYGPETVSALQEGKALRIADTDYVLIEFHTTEEYSAMEKAVQSLVRAGYRPILAHAERYAALRKSTDYASELVYFGARIQINSATLLKGALDSEFRISKKLIKEDLVHFLGSDCHDNKIRRPQMREAAEKLHKMAGDGRAERILCENAMLMLQNKAINA